MAIKITKDPCYTASSLNMSRADTLARFHERETSVKDIGWMVSERPSVEDRLWHILTPGTGRGKAGLGPAFGWFRFLKYLNSVLSHKLGHFLQIFKFAPCSPPKSSPWKIYMVLVVIPDFEISNCILSLSSPPLISPCLHLCFGHCCFVSLAKTINFIFSKGFSLSAIL